MSFELKDKSAKNEGKKNSLNIGLILVLLGGYAIPFAGSIASLRYMLVSFSILKSKIPGFVFLLHSIVSLFWLLTLFSIHDKLDGNLFAYFVMMLFPASFIKNVLKLNKAEEDLQAQESQPELTSNERLSN